MIGYSLSEGKIIEENYKKEYANSDLELPDKDLNIENFFN